MNYFSSLSRLEIIAIVLLFIIFAKLILKLSICVWNCFLGRLFNLGVKWNPGENIWAIITGATDGIGLQYARQLAAKGYSLLIISRNEAKLNSVSIKLLAENPNCKQIKTCAVDFSRDDIYDKINDAINTLEIVDVLVNNVGTLYPYPEYFSKIQDPFNKQYFNINMLAVTKMTSLVLPIMQRQQRGIIINVSSQAGQHVMPLMTTYSASKAYMTFLSQGLAIECASNGIVVQTVLPNQVKTNLVSETIKFPYFAVTPEEYVSSAIKTVGIESTTSGHWKHKILNFFHDLFYFSHGNHVAMKLTYLVANKYRSYYYKKKKPANLNI